MQESTSPIQTPRSATFDAQPQPPLGLQSFSPTFVVASRTPLLLLGAFSMAAMGCSFAASNRDTDGAVSTMAPEDAPARPTVRFNEPANAPVAQQPSVGANASEGLVDALAASYASDMATLAEMQRTQRAAAAEVATTPSFSTSEFSKSTAPAKAPAVRAKPLGPTSPDSTDDPHTGGPTHEEPKAEPTHKPQAGPTHKPQAGPTHQPQAGPTHEPTHEPQAEPTHEPTHEPAHEPAAQPPQPPTEPAAGNEAEKPTETPSETPSETHAETHAATAPAHTNAAVEPKATTTPAPATTASATALPGSPDTVRANGALELPPAPAPTPTEPAELATLLAESLAKQGETSSQPMREWLAFAAVAVANPDLKLPDNFGADLLPSERDRVVKAHAAFVKVGTALRDGQCEVDRTITESLVAALTGGPKLAIPKVDLCTRVDGFGRYTPLANHKFLARANSRFIVYTELDGFNSDYTDGGFVTRLATRVSIESERDNIEVWQRSPEWTAVVDSSDVRRDEFFLCEIIPVSEYLSVGSYRLKIEVRDETTGTVAVSTVPIQIVADPAMAAVSE